tara:strand:- start:161 stop:526 length:366 start_codon:yes stop_codon:yes gene_type:complete
MKSLNSPSLSPKCKKTLCNRKGSLNELKLCCLLVERGYEVFRNINPDGPIDIIAVCKKTMTTHYIDSKAPSFYRSKLNNTVNILTKEQQQKGIKAMILYEENIYYVDKDNYNLKKFLGEEI